MSDIHSQHSLKVANMHTYNRAQWRMDVFNDTRQKVEQLSYITPSMQAITLDPYKLNAGIQNNFQISSPSDIQLPQHNSQKPQIIVYEGDCLEAAQHFIPAYPNQVCVLNMANPITPGGGVEHGAGAQEENLFRRSNYFQHLYNQERAQYPMSDAGGIYSPQVCVFKGSEASEYELLNVPYYVNMIAVAAIPFPNLVNGKYNQQQEALTRDKIKAILHLASHFSQKIVVLSAFGCGAFLNPATEIARLFKEEILDVDTNWGFEKVVFAIFNDHNAITAINPQGNVVPFAEAFGVEIVNELS